MTTAEVHQKTEDRAGRERAELVKEHIRKLIERLRNRRHQQQQSVD